MAIVDRPDCLPTQPGAYGLVLHLHRPLAFRAHVLPVGIYLYAGSAKGPGGIRARVLRHLNAHKRRHWHIDHLTAAVPISSVLAFPGADECAVLDAALDLPGAHIPVPGFGSSDCSYCPAHLVRLPRRVRLNETSLAVGTTAPVVGWRLSGSSVPPARLFPD